MDVVWNMELPLEATPQAAPEEARAVAASLKGDHDAFTELVRQHQRRVFRLAGRFFRRPEDVEDVAQDTFLTAWKSLHTYKAKAPFENWLTRVCLNCCYERLRKRKVKEQTLGPGLEPAARVAAPEAALEVERLLQTLQPHDRFILLLLDGEGWSVAEIADRLGWTNVNVKVRAHRARKKLRQLLERGQES